MPTLTETLQANIRAVTGTVGQYVEDWHALFDIAAIPVGQWGERLIDYYLAFNTVQDGITVDACYNYFLLNPGAVTGGTMQSLFSASEQGAWYDPSDFSTLFQDSAGTTPVTAVGQPVGKMNDKSGRGNHVIQAAAASRPVLQQDGTGRYFLSTDGSDDWMVTIANIDFSATANVVGCVGARKVSDAATQIVFEAGTNVNTVNGTFALAAPATAAAAEYRAIHRGATAAAGISAAGFAAPDTAVITSIYNLSAPSVSIRRNGVFAGSNAGPTGGGTFSNNLLYLFRRAGTSFPFGGNFYGAVIRGAASSASQVAAMESFMNAKTGAF